MGAKPEDEAHDYEGAAIAMLTLRSNTPVGEWLSDDDLEVFGTFQEEAIAADGDEWGNEYMLLAMMNAAWLAIQHLAALTGESQSSWLQKIATDLRGLSDQKGEEN